jgi:hypothetical protein
MSESRNKPFEGMSRDELDGYARDWGIEDADSLDDDQLRKRLRDQEGTTGTAPESSLPVEERGDPGEGPTS